MSSPASFIIGIPFIVLGAGILLFYRCFRVQWHKSRYSEIVDLVTDGLDTFMRRVTLILVQILVYLAVFFAGFFYLVQGVVPVLQGLGFAIGVLVTGVGTYVGIKLVPRLVRRMQSKSTRYMEDGLAFLLDCSAAMAFVLVGSMFLGLGTSFYFFGLPSVIGFGIGVMVVAFFLRIGGGIYKSSADLSASSSLASTESIPQYDRRNPATLLEMAGDLVGDLVGYTTDILSSFVVSIVAALIVGYVAVDYVGGHHESIVLISMSIVSLSLFVSLISYGVGAIRLRFYANNVLLEALYVGVVFVAIGAYFVIDRLGSVVFSAFDAFPFVAFLLGLVGAVFIGFTSEYLTTHRYAPARHVAKESHYGVVMSLFNGISIGLKGNGLLIAYLACIFVPSYLVSGVFGIALAALGMLCMTPGIVMLRIFTPLASNAYKIATLSDCDPTVLRNLSKIRQVGRTTVALGNGFSTGATLVASFSLLVALVFGTGLMGPELLMIDMWLIVGGLIGIAVPSVFSGYLLRGVVQSVIAVIDEVARQFREIPYLFEDKARPDVIEAADQHSLLSLKALTVPGVMLVLIPLVFGQLNTKLAFGFVVGAVACSVFQGYYWTIMGDSLNGARHCIDADYFGGRDGSNYRAIMNADNFGNVFKDILGPSVSIFIKSIIIVTLLVFSVG